jgi:hypothetical protein
MLKTHSLRFSSLISPIAFLNSANTPSRDFPTHVDEIDNDNTAQGCVTELPRNGLCSLQIVL